MDFSQVLHSGLPNKNAFKALIAAEYSCVKVDVVKDFQMGVTNKSSEFLKMNPIGKVTSISRSVFAIETCFFYGVMPVFRCRFWRLLTVLFLKVMQLPDIVSCYMLLL